MDRNTLVQAISGALLAVSMLMVAVNAVEDRRLHPVTLWFWAWCGFIPAGIVMFLTFTFPL